MNKEVKVLSAYKMEVVQCFADYDAAYNWMINQAVQENFGLWRYWEQDGYGFYDIGPRVYAVAIEDIEQTND